MNKIPVRQLDSAKQELPSGSGFKIRRVEDILRGEDLIHHLHKHDFFFILALFNGSGTHEIDFTAYQILNFSIFFLRPGQVHKLELKSGSSGYLVAFSREFYQPKEPVSDHRLRKASNKNYCQLEFDRFNRIIRLLDSTFYEFNTREEGFEDVIKSNLDIFFIELVRQSPHVNNNASLVSFYTQERFEEFMDLVDRHIITHKQISQYSAMMNLSLYQLNEITRSSIGKTASELINERILLEAKRYLLATSNQVKDIAGQLGYEDTSYFIRFFKKHMGHSPEAYRQMGKRMQIAE